MWLCRGVLVKNEAHILFLRRRHPMLLKGGTLFFTFVFVNLENEQPVNIETV